MATNYRYQDLTVGWQTNYSHSVLYSRNATAEDYEKYIIPSSILHNLRVGYDLTTQAHAYIGVNNVADKDWLGTPGASRGGSTYPIKGRSYYVGVNYQF